MSMAIIIPRAGWTGFRRLMTQTRLPPLLCIRAKERRLRSSIFDNEFVSYLHGLMIFQQIICHLTDLIDAIDRSASEKGQINFMGFKCLSVVTLAVSD